MDRDALQNADRGQWLVIDLHEDEYCDTLDRRVSHVSDSGDGLFTVGLKSGNAELRVYEDEMEVYSPVMGGVCRVNGIDKK